MISLKIADVKDFMHKLLVSDEFNRFLLSEATITTYNTFTIDGHIHKEFYSSEEIDVLELEKQNFISYWEQLKPICFDLIKGKKTPLNFKMVFILSPSNTEKLLNQNNISLTVNDINGLVLNIKYENGSVICITGTSIKIFTLDKSLEEAWDSMVKKYFISKQITFEEL